MSCVVPLYRLLAGRMGCADATSFRGRVVEAGLAALALAAAVASARVGRRVSQKPAHSEKEGCDGA